jgi:hypothetical protein
VPCTGTNRTPEYDHRRDQIVQVRHWASMGRDGQGRAQFAHRAPYRAFGASATAPFWAPSVVRWDAIFAWRFCIPETGSRGAIWGEWLLSLAVSRGRRHRRLLRRPRSPLPAARRGSALAELKLLRDVRQQRPTAGRPSTRGVASSVLDQDDSGTRERNYHNG